jgi:hypothetical protein
MLINSGQRSSFLRYISARFYRWRVDHCCHLQGLCGVLESVAKEEHWVGKSGCFDMFFVSKLVFSGELKQVSL